VFAFTQEYRAERASERLRDLLPRRVTVRRDGRYESIDAIELVPDDVVVLDAGDGVSADMCRRHLDRQSDPAWFRGHLIDRSMLLRARSCWTRSTGAGTLTPGGKAWRILRGSSGIVRAARHRRTDTALGRSDIRKSCRGTADADDLDDRSLIQAEEARCADRAPLASSWRSGVHGSSA
jgi:hypothetical protein